MKIKSNCSYLQHFSKGNRQKGFTRIELFVVIFVAGVIPTTVSALLANHLTPHQVSPFVCQHRCSR